MARPEAPETHPQQPHPTVEQEHAQANDEAQLALSGVAAARYRRAREVVEKMDHKDDLYHGLGRVAQGERYPSERSQTLPERLVEARLDRKRRKSIEAMNNASRERAFHGPDRAATTPSVRKTVADTIFTPLGGTNRQMGIGRSVFENTKQVIVGPDLPGRSKMNRRIARGINRYEFLTGQKTALEATDEKYGIQSDRLKLGNKGHRITRRRNRRHQENLELASSQPILSAWRDGRRQRALRTMERIEAAARAEAATATHDDDSEAPTEVLDNNYESLQRDIRDTLQEYHTTSIDGLRWREYAADGSDNAVDHVVLADREDEVVVGRVDTASGNRQPNATFSPEQLAEHLKQHAEQISEVDLYTNNVLSEQEGNTAVIDHYSIKGDYLCSSTILADELDEYEREYGLRRDVQPEDDSDDQEA